MAALVHIAEYGPFPGWFFGCCGAVLGLPLGMMMGAVILRAAVQWVLKFDLEFGKACGVTAVVGVVNLIVGFVIGPGMASMVSGSESGSTVKAQIIASLISLLPGFLICAFLYGVLIRYPRRQRGLVPPPVAGVPTQSYAGSDQFEYRSGVPIGFGKGALMAAMAYAIGLSIVLFFGVVVYLVMQ